MALNFQATPETNLLKVVLGEIPVDADKQKERVEALLEKLSPREREVIKLRFGLKDGTCRSLDEVAQLHCITRERIRQIEARALSKLRNSPGKPVAKSADARIPFSMPIVDLNLSVRARKCLGRLEIKTLGDLLERTADDLFDAKLFNSRSLEEIRAILKKIGFRLRFDS